MTRRAAFLLLLCALAACREDAPAPQPQKQPEPAAAVIAATPGNDEDNSLNLLYGAAVVSRDGELHLETSAVHTIDGFAETLWTSAPGVPEDTIVYSMLAPTRLQRVGISTNAGDDAMESVAFDTSMDGKRWTELATLKVARTDQRQFVDLKTPVVAQYLRVRTIDPPHRYYVRLRGVHAIGEEVGPPQTPPFTGCWRINGELAHLVQNGARITGTIAGNPPTSIEGGTDNRVGMIMWMRGPTFGYAAITRSPDGAHLSGLSFFEEADKNIGEGWFGERCADGRESGGDGLRTPKELFARAKRLSLYGVVFDSSDRVVEDVSAPALDAVAALIATSPQRLRIVAHELRYPTPEQNRAHATARLQSIRAALEKHGVNVARIEFANAGDDAGGIVVRSSLQRALLSRVDLVSGT
ncbi:MAG TPA: discoidin domain-containing protein [Thermoanaerobaculia bacterium]